MSGKAKPKANTTANQNDGRYRNEPVRTQSKSAENACDQVTISFKLCVICGEGGASFPGPWQREVKRKEEKEEKGNATLYFSAIQLKGRVAFTRTVLSAS